MQNQDRNFELKRDLGNAEIRIENANSCVLGFIQLFSGTMYVAWLPSLAGRSKPYMRV